MNDRLYLVYRRYSQIERPRRRANERTIFYGWTKSKNVVKAFFAQRSKHKYDVVETDLEEIGEKLSENSLNPDDMIDFIVLHFAGSKESIQFFMTKREMFEAEIRIERYFRDMCNLVTRDKGNTTLLLMYMNLLEYYTDALEFIGFSPPEIDDLNGTDSSYYDLFEESIERAYEESPYDEYERWQEPPGSSANPRAKFVYSIESFIKVLRDDL